MTAERMCLAILHLLLIFLTLTCQASAENEKEDKASCPGQQRAFGGSCFAFVGVKRTFYSAQEWCEERGGHLPFIPDKDTQYFLEKHLDSEKNTWLGMAPSFSSNQQQSLKVEGKAQKERKTNCCGLNDSNRPLERHLKLLENLRKLNGSSWPVENSRNKKKTIMHIYVIRIPHCIVFNVVLSM